MKKQKRRFILFLVCSVFTVAAAFAGPMPVPISSAAINSFSMPSPVAMVNDSAGLVQSSGSAFLSTSLVLTANGNGTIPANVLPATTITSDITADDSITKISSKTGNRVSSRMDDLTAERRVAGNILREPRQASVWTN